MKAILDAYYNLLPLQHGPKQWHHFPPHTSSSVYLPPPGDSYCFIPEANSVTTEGKTHMWEERLLSKYDLIPNSDLLCSQRI